MADAQTSTKKIQIQKSMTTMVTVASVAILVTVFSLLSAHSLLSKLTFQNRVISAKTTARNQLNADIVAASKLSNSYENFNQSSTNLLGQPASGIDNDNAKVILDALPSSYDYPALVTSLGALLSNQGLSIGSIGGTDTSATVTTASGGAAIAMPFTITVSGPYANIQNIVNVFQKSIRPFQFQTLTLSGSQSDVTMTVSAQTYYQPATKFTITSKAIQ